MSGKINIYVVLKADFNCKLMFCKINIYFTNLYSTFGSEPKSRTVEEESCV